MSEEENQNWKIKVPRENRHNTDIDKINNYFAKIQEEARQEAKQEKKNITANEVIISMLRRAKETNERKPIFDTLDEAKRAYYRAMLINCNNKFKQIPELFDMMISFSAYFSNFEYNVDLKQGIGIIGNSGIGKTFMFESALILAKSTNQNKFTIYTAKDINREVLADARNYDKFLKHDILIDDLGIEEANIVSYGTKSSPVSDIIFDRERLWQNEGIRTHVTTNLSYDEIQKRYGDRTMNRLRRMTSFIDLN